MLYSISDKPIFERDLDTISGMLHDGVCTQFTYNRNNQDLNIIINNRYSDYNYYQIPISLTFQNIKMFFSTHLDMWGRRSPGNENEEILGIEPLVVKDVCNSLNFLQSIKCAGGLSQTEISELLSVRFLFHTGNEVILLCENVSISPDSIL